MTVWLLYRVEPYENDELLELYTSFESADKARREHHDVPFEYDRHYDIVEWEVKK